MDTHATRLDQVIERHEAFVRRLALRLAPTPSIADELAQEAFVVLWEKHRGYDLTRDAEPLLAGILRNLARRAWDRWRRSTRRFRDASICELADSEASADADAGPMAARASALAACMRELSPAHRTVIERRYRDDHSIEAIAHALGSTTAAIQMSLSRIRRRLRHCMERRLAVLNAPSLTHATVRGTP